MAAKKKQSGLEATLDTLREQADKVERAATKHGRKHIFGRLNNLQFVKRNIILWLGLLLVLIVVVVLQTILYNQSYRAPGPAPGGTYAEGVVGEISSFNPLYSATEDEIAVSRLMYSSLLTLDDTNNLRSLAAENYTVSNDGLTYNVKLRGDVRWQNSNNTLTADDVIFTVSLIQDPLVSSTLYDTWRSVKTEKIDNNSVQFTLRSPLAMFPHALTFGILSKENLGDIKPAEIREYLSENVARGSGPFIYHNTSTSQAKNKIISFNANPNYFLGKPKIDSLTVGTFVDATGMIESWKAGEINVAVDIPLKAAQNLALTNLSDIVATPIDRGIYAIFNNSRPTTSNKAIRQALQLAINRDSVRELAAVGGIWSNELNTPIAPGIFNSIDRLKQPAYNPTEAARLLDVEGWAIGADKLRMKGDTPMTIEIVTLHDSDYEIAAGALAEQWRTIGIDAKVILADAGTIQQNYIIPRAYDVLVYQMQLGADPDVYSYWHSSGAKAQGLNLANFNSPISDLALSRGRTGVNREANYQIFVNDWLDKVPAIALYQSNYYSLSSSNIRNFGTRTLADKSDRFRGIINFSVNTTPVFQTP
jgi:peptide/nickel transport system substrate-binding protein